METLKNCSRCGIEYPATLEFFYKKLHSPTGLRSECKNCGKLDDKIYINKNRDKRKQYESVYRLNNIDKYKKKEATYRKTLKGIYVSYTNNAKSRNLEMSLTIEEVDVLTSQCCSYCGRLTMQRVGIDRVDNSQGYTIPNSVPCCFECNRAKATMSESQYIALCLSVCKHKNVIT